MFDLDKANTWLVRAERALEIIALRMETERNSGMLHRHIQVYNELCRMINIAIKTIATYGN